MTTGLKETDIQKFIGWRVLRIIKEKLVEEGETKLAKELNEHLNHIDHYNTVIWSQKDV